MTHQYPYFFIQTSLVSDHSKTIYHKRPSTAIRLCHKNASEVKAAWGTLNQSVCLPHSLSPMPFPGYWVTLVPMSRRSSLAVTMRLRRRREGYTAATAAIGCAVTMRSCNWLQSALEHSRSVYAAPPQHAYLVVNMDCKWKITYNIAQLTMHPTLSEDEL